MKAFYSDLFLKRIGKKIPYGSSYRVYIAFWLLSVWPMLQAKAQYTSDLGYPSYSNLTWDHISSVRLSDQTSASVGLTKDGRIYTWGGNQAYTSNNGISAAGRHMLQVAPYFVKIPAGETPVKVRVTAAAGYGLGGSYGGLPLPTFFCLTASGNMYAWGINDGIAGSNLATFPVATSLPAEADTTKAKRSPILMTNIGESSFVDMDFSKALEFGVVIGASGTAYHIGLYTPSTFASTFAVLPKPSGASSSFKYTKVWVNDFANSKPRLYLKGNDGNIYFTSTSMNQEYSSGVPALFGFDSPALTTAESSQNIRLINPRLVPFPTGEDIIDMNVRSELDNTYAISASGKAYVAGTWRYFFSRGSATPSLDYRTYVIAPLAAAPPAGQLYSRVLSGDSTYYLKQFQQIAMPAGVTSVLSIVGGMDYYGGQNYATLMVGNNNKVYWSGSGYGSTGNTDITAGNFLQLTSSGAPSAIPDECNTVGFARSNSYYSWLYEATNYRGSQKIFRPDRQTQLGFISVSGRGYFVGQMTPNTAPGKVVGPTGVFLYTSIYPVPIANEQLLSCNTSPGTGGLGLDTTTPVTSGTATIDCSKTQLAPAPVSGVSGQTGLIITMTVSATGSFPLTISGSGMSLANGVTSVIAKTTGTQQFYIPLLYDGSTLGMLNFTVGTATNAGSCSADLTKSPKQTITNVWTLDCVPTAGPGLR